MAKAAYCSACGQNVYVADDGTCPQGHGPEYLSNYYEAPDMSPADHATFDAGTVAGKKRGNRVLIIVLVVVGVLVLCGLGSCVAGIAGLSIFSSEIEQTATEPAVPDETFETPDTTDETGSGSTVQDLLGGLDVDPEIYAMTTHFFPTFEPVSYYLVGDGTEDPLELQVIGASATVPEFRMAFVTYRYADSTVGPDDDPAWYFGSDANSVWERALEAEKNGASVYDFAGVYAMIDDAQRSQIMTDFTSAHPGYIMTGVRYVSETEMGLLGISDADLEDGDGTYATFDSTWTLDTASGTWSETSFAE